MMIKKVIIIFNVFRTFMEYVIVGNLNNIVIAPMKYSNVLLGSTDIKKGTSETIVILM